MSYGLFTKYPLNFSDTRGLPQVVDYEVAIPALDNFVTWIDLDNPAAITLVDDKISEVAPRFGTLSLAQTEAANRPTFDAATGRATFSSASAQFLAGVGNFPTSAVTVAVILRRSETATATEGIIGSTSPNTGYHAMFFSASGEVRYRVSDNVDPTFEDPESPVPATNENVIIFGDYSQATDQARCRIGDGNGGASDPTVNNITMNTSWFVGALTSGAGSAGNFEISDVFIFDAPIIGTAAQDVILGYARAVKGVA